MLESGHRNALRFHGALLAAYVEYGSLSEEDRRLLESNLRLAHELGAEVHCLHGEDFVETILDFARDERVTQLFLGHTGDRRLQLWERNPLERLIEAADGFDVRLFPHEEKS
jgi:two-component system sensor histidine kinase KdpD